jgi:hypothetical protein
MEFGFQKKNATCFQRNSLCLEKKNVISAAAVLLNFGNCD